MGCVNGVSVRGLYILEHLASMSIIIVQGRGQRVKKCQASKSIIVQKCGGGGYEWKEMLLDQVNFHVFIALTLTCPLQCDWLMTSEVCLEAINSENRLEKLSLVLYLNGT